VYWECVDSPDSCVKQTGVMRGGANGYVTLPEGGEILTSATLPNINVWIYFLCYKVQLSLPVGLLVVST